MTNDCEPFSYSARRTSIGASEAMSGRSVEAAVSSASYATQAGQCHDGGITSKIVELKYDYAHLVQLVELGWSQILKSFKHARG